MGARGRGDWVHAWDYRDRVRILEQRRDRAAGIKAWVSMQGGWVTLQRAAPSGDAANGR